ncbi:MAG: hypothetical protein ABIJ75_11000 [Actinomycetota bacterium]
MKQTLKIGFTVLVVAALTMSGFALAQSDETPTDQSDTTQTATGDEIARGVAVIVERLAPLVEDGTITQGQAEVVAEQLADGFGPRGRVERVRQGLGAAAEFLGIDVEDLVDQLRDGATLAEIAGDQADELIAALVAEAEDQLAQAVDDGRITQAQADERLAEIEDHLTAFVNDGLPERPMGPMGGGCHGWGGGPGGPGGFGSGGDEAPATGAEA